MAVMIYDSDRVEEIGEVTIATSGGAVTGDVRVTIDDALTKSEALQVIDKIKASILQDEAWAGA